MPEVNMNEREMNDHVNNNPMTGRRPLTECGHTVPYGPGTGKEDPRANDPKPTDSKEQWQGQDKPNPTHSSDQDPEHGPGVN